MSGKVSTATSSPSGAIGAPIVAHTGAIALTKLTVPGRLTEPSEVSIATTAPTASVAGVSVTPNQVAI